MDRRISWLPTNLIRGPILVAWIRMPIHLEEIQSGLNPARYVFRKRASWRNIPWAEMEGVYSPVGLERVSQRQ